MKRLISHIMLVACVGLLLVDCTCSSKIKNFFEDEAKGYESEVDTEDVIQTVPVTKKQVSNGDDFWYGGTCREVSDDNLEVCTNKYHAEQNDFMFMSMGSINTAIAIIDSNEDYYSFTDNVPDRWVQAMASPITSDRWICSTFVYDEDSWIIIYSDKSYKQKGCPEALIDCISDVCADEQIYDVSFNNRGNWVVTTDENVYGDDEVGAFISRADDAMPDVDFCFFHVYGKAMIASSFDGIYFENIPANMANKIQEVKYAAAIVACNDAGEYLIGDNGTNYYDACFTSRHVNELKGNLSKFVRIGSSRSSDSSYSNSSTTTPSNSSQSSSTTSSSGSSSSSSTTSPSNSSSNSSSGSTTTSSPAVVMPVIQPYPCGICSGTRRCPSCNGRGTYYAHDRYHTCGVCNGSGICTGCNGTGIQTY